MEVTRREGKRLGEPLPDWVPRRGSPRYLKSFLPTCPALSQSLRAGRPLLSGKQFIWEKVTMFSFGSQVLLQENWGTYIGLGGQQA